MVGQPFPCRSKTGQISNTPNPRLARWELFNTSRITPRLQKRLSRAEEDASTHKPVKPEDLPLRELKQLHINLLSRRRQLAAEQQPAPAPPPCKQLSIYEKAYAASLADAQRLCPGREPLPLGGGEASNGWDLRPRVRDLGFQIEDNKQEQEEVRGWIDGLPEGVVEAKKLAEAELEKWVGGMEHTERAWRACKEDVEREGGLVEEGGAGGLKEA